MIHRLTIAAVLALSISLALNPVAAQTEQPVVRIPIEIPASISVENINSADLLSYVQERAMPETAAPVLDPAIPAEAVVPTKVVASPAIARLQVLLDQAGASPGVIDGFDGDNLVKAIAAFQMMAGLPVDGVLNADLVARLDAGQAVIGNYVITDEDAGAITAPTPVDYAEKAQMAFLGYSSVAEELAERFHMDIDLLKALNPDSSFAAGAEIVVAAYGPNLTGEVARIEADKARRQVRAYSADGALLAAYPATIGSDENPSPSGTHVVEGVAAMPEYTYNPKVNFQQGGNTEVLTIPPGPNGPVGSMWIDLSEPTFGIHGTPEPSLIDKTGSHGCVRLTNWDAEELSKMVKPGIEVVFTG